MSDESLISELKKYPGDSNKISYTYTQEEKEAQTVDSGSVLPNEIATLLPYDLYTHQARALQELENNENVTVATSTSSGKTFVYGLRAAINYLRNGSKTLIFYPTKALSRDQLSELRDLYDTLSLDIQVDVYDGDTSQSKKKNIRKNSDVIITNFAGMNAYLPYHRLWSSFFGNLGLVVLDESHSYSGVQGMHVAWILRRLQRVLEYYDSDPQYVLTTATIGNPRTHGSKLIGKPVVVVDEDGSPRGKRDIVFWDVSKDVDAGDRVSVNPNKDAAYLTTHLGYNKIQTLTFLRSRKLTELSLKWADEWLDSDSVDYLPNGVNLEAYNASHGKETRRETEDEMKSGKIDGIFSTNALEVGINIGGVEATVISGYPGTRQSFWQQIGRSGRGKKNALSVFVGDYNSIDQYIMNNPKFLTEQNVEEAVIDLDNNDVYAKHVLAAADELSITEEDFGLLGDEERLRKAVEMWKVAGKLSGDFKRGITYSGAGVPQENINIYSTSDETFEVRTVQGEDDIDIEPIQKEMAYRDFHKGAIYLYRGKRYEVVKFVDRGMNKYVVLQEADDVDYYTQTTTETNIGNIERRETRELANGIEVFWGTAKITTHHKFYHKLSIETGDIENFNLPTGVPPSTMETQIMGFDIPQAVEEKIKDKYADYVSSAELEEELGSYVGYMGGLHGAEHGMISIAPLELQMDKGDLGGLSTISPTGSAIFIYDGVPGGVGFSHTIYEKIEDILERTKEMIQTCECTRVEGCPACVMDNSCGNNNEPLHKKAATEFIDYAIGEKNIGEQFETETKRRVDVVKLNKLLRSINIE